MKADFVSWKPTFIPLESNIFLQIFRNKEDAVRKMKQTTKMYQNTLYNINKAIEEITLLTLDKDSKSSLEFLPTLAAASRGQTWLDLELLDAAIFQRLLYMNVKKVGQKSKQPVEEPGQFIYLFQCYTRAKKQLAKENDELSTLILSKIESTIVRNTITTIRMPKMFGDIKTENIGSYILKFLKSNDNAYLLSFLENSMENMEEVEGNRVDVLENMFNELYIEIKRWTLSNTMQYCETLELLTQIASKNQLGLQLLKYSFPSNRKNGKAWEKTILGSLLSVSVICKKREKPEFFCVNAATMLISDYKINEQNAFSNADLLSGYVFRIWENLLKGNAECKHTALEWIAQCLQANKGRKSEMANHGGGFGLYSSTAFFINLENLLLEFSVKFMRDSTYSKLLSVSPQYFKHGGKDVYLKGFDNETTLVEYIEEEEAEIRNQSVFSDIFFMTHVALDLGMNQAQKEIKKMEDEMRNIRDCEKDLKSSMGKKEVYLNTTALTENGLVTYTKLIRDENELKVIKDEIHTQHSCLRTAMMNPATRKSMNTFFNGSTVWLLHQCGLPYQESTSDSFKFQLSSKAPKNLTFIPEFMFENLYNFLNLENMPPMYGKMKLKMFSGGIQSTILKLLTILMQTNWIKNPHLRARVAKALSLLLPEVGNREDIYRSAALLQPSVDSPLLQPQAVEEAENLFRNISGKRELVQAIMKVYVSLEVAGESLQFEQKFNYRLPINFVLFYLLKIDAYREILLEIAKDGHKNMGDQQPPIFLRFVNGMINDGTWLLDESLSNMIKIRKAEEEIASPIWNSLADEVKKQKLLDLKKSKNLTRSMNVMSNDVVRMLEALAKLTTQVFTHPDMVDRISAMMNYFMQRLTGKDRKQYKVKDPKDLFFDPLQLLKSLSHIYCSFATEHSFVLAISQDGRSYKAGMFDETLKILGRYEDVTNLQILAERVKEEAKKSSQIDDLSGEAPEDFLDPIMSTLMKEPVILPSSGKVVDRSTIAKHLLSDETDPFNRQPLTLDEVKPDHVLKEKIIKWLESHQKDKNPEPNIKDVSFSITPEDSGNRFSGGHSIGGNKLLPRIKRDLAEIYKENVEGIFVVPDEEDMTKIHVLMTGPEGTPYFGGFFYFLIQCPPSYPAAPPNVLFLTTDGGRVRFNPNLYRNGRVCLSVLGTTSGPGWTPALSLLSVLLTIRSILNAHPYHNIPETEIEKTPGDSERYNIIIKHETIRVALLQTLQNPPKDFPDVFLEEMKKQTRSNLAQIMKTLKEFKHMSGKEMKNDWLEIRAIFQFNNLEENMRKLALELGEGTQQNQGNVFTKKREDTEGKLICSEKTQEKGEKSKQATRGGHSVGGGRLLPRIRKDLAEIMNEAPEGMYIVPDEGDMTKLHAVITGPKDTPYEGGFFYFILQCPSNYPASPPKATLMTTDWGSVRFNPNLYRDGKVCLSILGTWSGPGWSPALSLLSVLLSIQTLLNEKPYYNEPGFEETFGNDQRSTIYNQIIRHETTRVAYLGMIKSPPEEMPVELHEKICEAALTYKEHHCTVCIENLSTTGLEIRDPMQENKGVFSWNVLKEVLDTDFIKKKDGDKISDETPAFIYTFNNS